MCKISTLNGRDEEEPARTGNSMASKLSTDSNPAEKYQYVNRLIGIMGDSTTSKLVKEGKMSGVSESEVRELRVE